MPRLRTSCASLAFLLGLNFAGGCAKAGMDAPSSYAEESYGGYDGDNSSVELTSAFGYDPLASSAGGAAPPAAPGDYDDAEPAPMRVSESYAEGRVSSDEADYGPELGSLRGAIERGADRRADRRAQKSKKSDARSVAGPASAASPEEPKSGTPEVALEKPDDPGKVATGEAETQEEAEDHGRQIIYTAAMVVAVHDVDESTERAEEIPKRFGGFVQQRRRGVLIMKIPAAKLQTVMEELAKYGIVQARQLQAQDVTAEYTDLESRIRVMRDTQAQLLELLKQAKNVEETLRVRQALDQVTMELEVALGRMRQLSESISFSTLTIQFAERRPQQNLPSSNDPFRWVDQLGVEGTEWR